MRRVSLLLLFLLLGSLAVVTAPVRAAGTSYYGVRFDGSGYISVNYQFTGSFTVVWIGKIRSNVGRQYIFNNGVDTASASTSYGTWAYYSYGNMNFAIVENNVSKRFVSFPFDKFNQSVMITCVYDASSTTMKLYENAELKAQRTDAVLTPSTTTTTYFASYAPATHNSVEDIYVIIVYNRALSDSEIRAIYNDPLNPPTQGLVFFYAPNSVDVLNNVWKDLSSNGIDATISGATYVLLRQISTFAEAYSMLDSDGTASLKTPMLDLGQWDSFTMVFITRRFYENQSAHIFSSVGTGENLVLVRLGNFNDWTQGYVWLYFGDSKSAVRSNTKIYANNTYFIAITGDQLTKEVKFYINGKLDATRTYLAMNRTVEQDYYVLGWGGSAEVYLVLIYARALNSTEIREIYEHPLDPPKDGLVLWYSPYSYDPTQNKWLNIAPIFPTIPLAEELDAQNYGAEPVRVSIPQASYYDIENNSEIPVENVSVAMVSNNTTISLIPSLLTLPYNSTVTLNVSASGYLPRTLTVPATIQTLTIYLQPSPSNGTATNSLTPPTETISTAFRLSENYNDHGLWGGRLGIYFLTGNWSEGFRRFWTLNSMFELVLPLLFAFGLILSSYLITRKPLVPVGVTAVTASFFGMIGVPLQLSLATPLAALFVFWIVYTLWDFYKKFERS